MCVLISGRREKLVSVLFSTIEPICVYIYIYLNITYILTIFQEMH